MPRNPHPPAPHAISRRALMGGLAAAPLALAQAAQRPNIILVGCDQMCADRLSCYGNRRPATPNMDCMAAEGARFSRFYSPAPWTAPTYGSMMTAQYPSRHGVTLFWPRDFPSLNPETSTVAELFKKVGYETAAFVNNGVAGKYLTGRGFDMHDEGQRQPVSITVRNEGARDRYKCPAVTGRVLDWLGGSHANPFFLFILYIEPHSPYDPPPEHDLFKNDSYLNETNTGYNRTAGKLFRLANLRDPKAVDRLWQLYDGTIHFIDHYFGQVLDRLRTSGMDKNTIVFLTSDHGEMICTHPDDYMTFDHRSLYDPVMHVPAIVWGAGTPKGKTFNALASSIDIAPTLLELAGLPAKADAQGNSLAPIVAGRKTRNVTHLLGEQDVLEPLRSVRDDRYKLIVNTLTGKKQLYEFVADPAERRELSKSQPRIVERMGALIDQWRKENEPPQAETLAKWHQIAARSAAQAVVDEVTTGAHCQLTGMPWQLDDNEKDNAGGAYWTEPAKPGETPRSATWRSDNPLLGRYRISIWYGPLTKGGVATDVPPTVRTRAGEKSFRIDQTRNIGEWQEPGEFDDPLGVIITNQANGRVIADAVRFERLPG